MAQEFFLELREIRFPLDDVLPVFIPVPWSHSPFSILVHVPLVVINPVAFVLLVQAVAFILLVPAVAFIRLVLFVFLVGFAEDLFPETLLIQVRIRIRVRVRVRVRAGIRVGVRVVIRAGIRVRV